MVLFQLEELKMKAENADFYRDELDKAEKTIADLNREIADLKARIAELERENAELRGRVKKLEGDIKLYEANAYYPGGHKPCP